MDAETARRVFDPFFTTKPVGKGTGLGLSVFSTYIREVKGALGITSRLGEGTLCSIYVPLSTDQVHSESPEATGRLSGGGETILLAEDEDIVAQAMTMLLTHAGYQIIRCADGREAVDRLREGKEKVDLALLDFRMPIMTGAEAYLEMRNIDPDLPVILMSGNLSVPEFRDLEAKGLRAILRKPCSRLELITAIRGVLGDTTSS
jgi:CheY-like chemotaxis protein